MSLAAGQAEASDAATPPPADAAPRVRADLAVLRLLSAAKLGEVGAVGEALLEMALLAGYDSAGSFADTEPAWKTDLLARAVARARLGGSAAAEAVGRRAWEISHHPALAAALSDLPVVAGAWPQDRPDRGAPARGATAPRSARRSIWRWRSTPNGAGRWAARWRFTAA